MTVWPQILLTLNQRQWLTRALCGWLIVSSALAAAMAVILIVSLFVVSEENRHLVWLWARPMALAILTHMFVSFILWAWRSCDRCDFHLYPMNDRGVVFGGLVHRGPMNARLPDHRASRFMGSLRSGAIISMALRGTTHCMWCGHADGTELEYVIKQ